MTALARDRLTWLIYAQLGTYGYFLYGFGPTVPLLRDEQEISRTLSGLHGSALAIGALLSALIFAPLVRRYGRAVVMWGGLLCLCLGAGLYVATTVLAVTLTGALLASFGGSFVITTTAAALSDHHGRGGPAAITEANAVAAGVGTVAPLVVGAAVGIGLGWRAALLLVVPAVAVLYAFGGRLGMPAPTEEPAHHVGSRRLPSRYWIVWGVLVCGIAVEFCMTLWTADILRNRFEMGDGAASAGITTLLFGMFLGRLAGGRLALRFDVELLLYAAIVVCAIGFAGFWVTTVPSLALAALLVCGLGIALFYPLGLALAIDVSEGRPDLASARSGLAAALASGGGPLLLGALADRFGIHNAFLVVPVLLAMAAVGIRIGGRSQRAASRA